MITNLVINTPKGYISVIREYLPIANIDSVCFTASTNIELRDSLFGACHVLRIVGKNAIKSIAVAINTDHNTLLASIQGSIAKIASPKQTLSNFVMSLVP